MLKSRCILVLLCAITVLFTAQLSFAADVLSKKLTIVFTGDARGEIENCHCPKDDFGGLPRRAKYIEELRKEVGEILLLDVGDVLPLITPGVTKKKISYNAFISFKAMEIMRYDAMNVGESDLVLGEELLKQKRSKCSFSFLSGNIIDKSTGNPFFKPYDIKTMKNGLRVGILGLVNERYAINSDRLKIIPHQEAAFRYITELRAQSDIVIVLAHLGLPYSRDLAEAVSGIDIILSGHWDMKDQEPIKIGRTLVMPTVYRSRKVGRIERIEQDGKYIYNWSSTVLDRKYDGHTVLGKLISKMPALKVEEPEYVKEAGALRVLVFYQPGCKACSDIKKDLLPNIKEKYSNRIAIQQYDINVPENHELMVRLERLYGAKGDGVPEVIVAGSVLQGKEDIMAQLEDVIQQALAKKKDVKKNDNLSPLGIFLILSRFESFNVYPVLIAGLLDGVNPCAFTTIVFFISFLAFVGYRRHEMFLAGLSFTIAVFITYLLIGLGIFNFLRSLDAFSYITYWLNLFIAGLAFFLGILCFLDYFRFKKSGDAKSILLKLPQSIRNKINSMIGMQFRGTEKGHFLRIIWIALSVGFMVSVLESLCTGQVYLPTITYVFKIPGRRLSALSYLLLYNLAFITPLIIAFLLGLFGVRSKAFSSFMEKHLGIVKLSTAVLFFALGALLITR